MTKNKQSLQIFEENKIIKFIFKGFSSAQIASKMNCSRSTVSYKIRALFKKYQVSNRYEFILSLISKLIFEKKQIILENQQTIDTLKKENCQLKEKLSKISPFCK